MVSSQYNVQLLRQLRYHQVRGTELHRLLLKDQSGGHCHVQLLFPSRIAYSIPFGSYELASNGSLKHHRLARREHVYSPRLTTISLPDHQRTFAPVQFNSCAPSSPHLFPNHQNLFKHSQDAHLRSLPFAGPCGRFSRRPNARSFARGESKTSTSHNHL